VSAARSDNFNLLRLAFAATVAAYHVAELSAAPAFAAWAGPLAVAGELSIQGFFILSGYLVYASLDRSRGVVDFAGKRLRRVYPAYLAVVLICAGAALAFSAAARADPAGVARYVGWNAVFLNFMEPELPGLFAGNPHPEVNGALWTIKIEAMFYIVLPVLGWLMARAGRWRLALLAAIYVAAEAWRMGFEQLAAADPGRPWAELSRQLPGQMSFFAAGMALFLLRGRGLARWPAGLAGAAVVALSVAVPAAEPARALALGLAVLALATAGPRLPDAARYGDVSYGLYVAHFPIIQGLVASGAFAASAIGGAAAALSLSLAAAVALWWTIERPALRPDSHYRRPRGGEAGERLPPSSAS
jgi:peptidoglycan/LPS O-acetylase OafA/YrhL